MAETRAMMGATPDIQRLWTRVRALEDRRVVMDDRNVEERIWAATQELRAELEALQERVSTLEGDAPSSRTPPVRIGPVSPN